MSQKIQQYAPLLKIRAIHCAKNRLSVIFQQNANLDTVLFLVSISNNRIIRSKGFTGPSFRRKIFHSRTSPIKTFPDRSPHSRIASAQ
ncbi:hypothetical protein PMIN02_002057 [Paraphaeosphaeria minitans]